MSNPHDMRAVRRAVYDDHVVVVDPLAEAVDNIAVNADDEAELRVTQSHNVACLPRYRKMVQEFIDWMEKKYPDLHEKIVFVLTEEMKADLSKFYHDATHDIR